MCATVRPRTQAVAPVEDPRSSISSQPTAASEAGVDEQHRRRRRAQSRGRDAELVADRRDDEQEPEEHQHRQRENEVVPVLRPERELRRRQQERADREPAPALPQEHRDGGYEGDHHEPERSRRRAAVDEHRSGERAEDPERCDELRAPADCDRRPGGADETCDEQADLRRDDVLNRSRVGQRRVERRERGRDGGDRGIRLPPPLVQEQSHPEERGRSQERERDASLDAEPPAIDGDDEEEDDADQDRKAADRGEDPSAEQVFERLPGRMSLPGGVGGGGAGAALGGGGPG